MDFIKSVVKCDVCSNILQKPVILPCGLIVCYKHVENLQNETIFCKTCGKDHRFEEKNKMVNRRLEFLIQSNLEKLNFGSEYKKAFDECNQLDQTIIHLETLNKDPVHFIKETIGKLKNKTELFREDHKLKIDDKANQIITKLDNYEKECIKMLDSSDFKQKIAKMDENIKKLKKDLEEWQNTLNDLSSSENQWKSIKENCQQPNLNLQKEIFYLKKQLLIDKLYQHLKIVSNFQNIQLTVDAKLNLEMDQLKDILVNFDIKNSKIIDNAKMQQLIELCNISSDKKWRLIYRASEHGFTAQDFHAKCDNIPNTLTIIKSTCGSIFGGFTSRTWDQSHKHKIDPSAYLFSLVNPQNQPQKLMTQTSSNAIYCVPECGPTFGTFGNELYINYSLGPNGSGLGYVYPQRNGNRPFLTESVRFGISDIDIYQID